MLPAAELPAIVAALGYRSALREDEHSAFRSTAAPGAPAPGHLPQARPWRQSRWRPTILSPSSRNWSSTGDRAFAPHRQISLACAAVQDAVARRAALRGRSGRAGRHCRRNDRPSRCGSGIGLAISHGGWRRRDRDPGVGRAARTAPDKAQLLYRETGEPVRLSGVDPGWEALLGGEEEEGGGGGLTLRGFAAPPDRPGRRALRASADCRLLASAPPGPWRPTRAAQRKARGSSRQWRLP